MYCAGRGGIFGGDSEATANSLVLRFSSGSPVRRKTRWGWIFEFEGAKRARSRVDCMIDFGTGVERKARLECRAMRDSFNVISG